MALGVYHKNRNTLKRESERKTGIDGEERKEKEKKKKKY